MGHNESNTRRLNEIKSEEEEGVVRNTIATIEKASGQKVKGWLGSGLQETWNTLGYLADNGLDYVADWVNDDQPYVMALDDGRSLMSIPYSVELNDKPAYEHRHVTPPEFQAMICRQFDVLWRESEKSGRAMAIALHPYITGVPHRIGALDAALEYISRHEGVWLATGAEIAAAGRKALGA
jgi:peptidoglycan/xylan/chitin deacetylase (PgdA/CDA1 family)